MLNILKKKLVSKFFFIFLIVSLLAYCSASFASIDIKQGDTINYDVLSKIYIGMSKNDVLKNFGIPILLPNCNSDCFCYYYYDLPFDKYSDVKYNYILMFFDKSSLVSYFFRL